MGIACRVPSRTLEPVWLSSVKSAAYFRFMTDPRARARRSAPAT